MSRSTTKPTQWCVPPAKTHTSLGIRPVWSEYSLCAQMLPKDPWFLHTDSEYFVFAGRTGHVGCFATLRLKSQSPIASKAPNAYKAMFLNSKWFLYLIIISSRYQCILQYFFTQIGVKLCIWATSWQNQQNNCAPSEDSDQPGHPPSLIRVFAVRSMSS